MSTLNADSTRLLSTAFPNGGAWVVTGRYDANDKLKPGKEGPAGSFDLPDDYDLYYCVAAIEKDRSDGGRVHVMVIDDVGKEIDQWGFDSFFPLKPSFTVESSSGSFQYGFIIDGGMDPADYQSLRRAMKANPIWGKAHNTGAVALYRLPQGTHTKSTKGGWKAREGSWAGLRYTEAELWAIAGEAPAIARASQGSKGDVIDDPAMLSELVDLIPNPAVDWDFFVNVGRAIWGASEGKAEEDFHRWADKLPGSDAGITQGRWDSYRDAQIGRHWLLREARRANPAAADAWVKKETDAVFADVEFPPDDGGEMVDAMQRTVANAIVKRYGDRIRWNVSTSMWHSFSGTWKESPHPLGYRLAKQWADAAAPTLGKAPLAAVSKSGFFEGVEKILRADPAIAVVKTDFDCDNWLLGTPGGTVDLRTGVLRASTAAEMISLSCSVAPALTEACPKWLAFVKWACTDPRTGRVDQGMLKTLQQWAGYCLTGDVSEEKVMFFHGGGANGKGTFVETLQAVMADYFHMAAKDLFMATKWGTHTEEVAVLAGKRMVVADEVPTSAQWNESMLKVLSGGGVMSSRHLYGKSFTFPVRFKITIVGNEKPTFQGAINDALKRRLRLMEFLNKADPQSNTLKRELVAEAPGVLRWMLNGLTDMLAGPGGGLFVADSVLSATDAYFKDSDLFQQWLDENTEATPGRDGKASELFEDWEGWRNKQGNHTLIGSHKKFKEEMLKRGKTWRVTKTGNVYNDLSIKAF